jgi:hypothetical protein
MPTRRGRLLPVLISALMLLGAANLGAFAATGAPLLLGKSNTANKTTKLKTTGNGPALKLKSRAGKAPFGVSNNTRIKKLNADLVDGLDGTALQTKAFRYNLAGTTTGSLIRFGLPGLPAGSYLVTYSVTAQLTGTVDFFGCVMQGSTPAAGPQVAALGATAGGNAWYVTGSGLLDTTAGAYSLLCQSEGGVGYSVPTDYAPAQIVLTRVDDVTTAASAGVPFTPAMKQPGLGG